MVLLELAEFRSNISLDGSDKVIIETLLHSHLHSNIPLLIAMVGLQVAVTI